MDGQETSEIILARLEEKIGAEARRSDEWREAAARKLESIDHELRGNGSRPGINVRLDRIEQRETTRAKLLWVTATAVVGSWVKMLLFPK
jgi:hypothetical protein